MTERAWLQIGLERGRRRVGPPCYTIYIKEEFIWLAGLKRVSKDHVELRVRRVYKGPTSWIFHSL
jgi:hypothetical protein